MTTLMLAPEVLCLVADRFKALGEPARLRILNCLRSGEKTVSELVEETECRQANVSKHLHVLYSVGLVRRRKDGLFVRYAIADERVYRLCDVMCDQLKAEVTDRRRLLQ
jgi:DNA-binding transcriptional ArsR family regulator